MEEALNVLCELNDYVGFSVNWFYSVRLTASSIQCQGFYNTKTMRELSHGFGVEWKLDDQRFISGSMIYGAFTVYLVLTD